MPNRRDFYRLGTVLLGGLMSLALAVPGVAFVLTPLRRKSKDGDAHELTTLSQLKVGVPVSFAIREERVDAWVKYPREPVGLVWLVRQDEGKEPKVIAFTAECPHLGCAVNLNQEGTAFRCPCHDSAFDFQGEPANKIPPRPMDRLDVELSADADPTVRVTFRRYMAQKEEKLPLV